METTLVRSKATPAPAVARDRFVDLLRAASICVVVLGHWLLAVVTWKEGELTGRNALAIIPQLHVLTWVLQVMPLFFFAGGFSNAVTLRDPSRDDGPAFVRRRLVRMLRPVAGFGLVWAAVAMALVSIGVSGERLKLFAATLVIPFWFLAVYSLLIVAAPFMHGLHRRYGARVPVALAACALLVDVAHRAVPAAGALNFLFVWLLPHQLGFFYADGSLLRAGRRTHALIAGIGFAGVVATTATGFAPVSMVGVPGAAASNNSPPSFALAMHGVWLVGLALLLRPALQRWLARPAAAAGVDRVNRLSMTLFLWHMTALVAGVYVLYPIGFPQPAAGSATWWATRPLWLGALTAILCGLVAAFARMDGRAGAARTTHAARGFAEASGGRTRR